MKVAMDKQTSRRLVKVTNYALVQVLKATVARLRKVEMELGDLELALEDEQEEMEFSLSIYILMTLFTVLEFACFGPFGVAVVITAWNGCGTYLGWNAWY
ncbi:hypothetical protein PHYBOEH_008626 [Phytophthora boehmeriae]|uniref:Uncharacterized protein n=1 Tax=Phytophthora boehmeriae TaxID=109152 RepID=A0A8T1W377_9STRA|nr:hypothetical protein PHYBOEH_008626 [Phytophthora boehmeriae]